MTTTKVEVTLYKDGIRWAKAVVPIGGIRDVATGTVITMANLEPLVGSTANLYRVTLVFHERLIEGWNSANLRLDVNYLTMEYPGWKPIAWYDHEETDWPSGLVRFISTEWTTSDPSDQTGKSMVWTVALRAVN